MTWTGRTDRGCAALRSEPRWRPLRWSLRPTSWSGVSLERGRGDAATGSTMLGANWRTPSAISGLNDMVSATIPVWSRKGSRRLLTGEVYVMSFDQGHRVGDQRARRTRSRRRSRLPISVAIPAWNGDVYVKNNQGTVSVISGGNRPPLRSRRRQPTVVAAQPADRRCLRHELLRRYPVGDQRLDQHGLPRPSWSARTNAAAVNPLTGDVYVTNYGNSTVSVISGWTMRRPPHPGREVPGRGRRSAADRRRRRRRTSTTALCR